MFRKLAKNIYYLGLSALHAESIRIRLLQNQNKIVVLNLHRVSPIDNGFWPPLHPNVFEGLLRFLKENFIVSRFDQLGEFRHEKPIAVLSFDDGYYDFIEYALPLLNKFGMPANMNIIPKCADSGKPIWNVQLYDFLQAAPTNLINEIDLPGFDVKLESEDQGTKLAFGLRISSFLKKRPRAEREELWRSLERVLAKLDFECTRMMNLEDVERIASEIEIGVHSFSHESMRFESSAFFEEDFTKCSNFFAEKLNIPLSIYAFPNGSYRLEQIEFLRSRGVEQILLVEERFADSDSDVFPRLTLYGTSPSEITMRAVGL